MFKIGGVRMTYNLNGELYVESKEAAKMLFEKLASIADETLSDKRDNIYIVRNSKNVTIAFDLRFGKKEQRDEIRNWLTEKHEYAVKGIIQEHTCNDDEGLPCSNFVEVLKWGDWDDE